MTAHDNAHDLLAHLRSATQAVPSPDGRSVAYTLGETDPQTLVPRGTVHTIGIDGNDDRAVGSGYAPCWLPDGSTVLFANGNAIRSSAGKTIATIEQPILGMALAPDGATAAVTVRIDPPVSPLPDGMPPVIVIRRRDFRQDGAGIPNDSTIQILLVDIPSGAVRRLSHRLVDYTTLRWSPDGGRIAAISDIRGGYTSAISVFDIASGQETIVEEPGRGWFALTWLDDATLIAGMMLSPEGAGLWRIDATSGARSPIPGTDDLTVLGDDAIVVLDRDRIAVATIHESRSATVVIDFANGTLHRAPVTDDLRMSPRRVNGDTLIQAWSGHTSNDELVVTDLASGATRQLTHLNRDLLTRRPPGSIEQCAVRNEGVDISYLLKKPQDFDPERRYPVVFEIHGGPNFVRTHNIEVSNQLLLDAGFLVVCPNPRGSTSWGNAYANAVHGDIGGCDWRDDLAVVDAVAALPYVDESRLGIFGYSYGGYIASWAIVQTNRFRAAAIGAPVTNLLGRDGTTELWEGLPRHEWSDGSGMSIDFGIERSPTSWLHRASTPTLILHPEDDQTCSISGSDQLFAGLHRAGVPVEYVRYPGQSHLMPWTGAMSYRIDYHARIVEWFQRYV